MHSEIHHLWSLKSKTKLRRLSPLIIMATWCPQSTNQYRAFLWTWWLLLKLPGCSTDTTGKHDPQYQALISGSGCGYNIMSISLPELSGALRELEARLIE